MKDIHKAMKHIDDDELVELSVRGRKTGKHKDEEYARLSVGSGRIKYGSH